MPDRLADLASTILATIVDAADVHEIDLPTRQFLADGEVAHDDAQLSVGVPTIYRGRPGNAEAGRITASAVWVAEFRVDLVRCVPMVDDDGNAPTAAALSRSAETILADGWLLTVGCTNGWLHLERSCTSLSVGPATAVGPSGGVGGWTMPLGVSL